MPLMDFGQFVCLLARSTVGAPGHSSGDGRSQIHAVIQIGSCPQKHLNLGCMCSLSYSSAGAVPLALLARLVLDSCSVYPSP